MALLIAITAALLGIEAPTAGDAIDLHWTAPPSCASADDVRAAIDRSLARESFDDAIEAVGVEGSIEAQPTPATAPVDSPSAERAAEQGAVAASARWVLRVRTHLPSGAVQREVVGDDCATLGEAAGLIIAVDLDPLRVLETQRPAAPEPEPEPVSRPPAPQTEPVSRPPAPQTEPAPAPQRRRAPSWQLRAAGLGELGSLSVLRGGAWVSVGLAWRRFEVALAGQYWGPRRIFSFAEQPSLGVMVQQGGVAVRGCYVPGAVDVRFSTCAGVEGGVARGLGIGLTPSVLSHPPWVAVTMGQAVTWIPPGWRVGLWGGVDAMLHVLRPQWRIEGLGMAARTRAVGVRVLLGPTLRW